MTEPRTLSNMDQLKDSGFGRLWPRHGLKLLHWFANDCIHFEDEYEEVKPLNCNPKAHDFGFEPFENRSEGNGIKLLPDLNCKYYEVGNLHKYYKVKKKRAIKMPFHVREDYRRASKPSNMDRLIVSFDGGLFGDIYVTEHLYGQSNFNKDATFHISRHLLLIIRGLNLDDFLNKAGYQGNPGIRNPKSQTRAPRSTLTATGSNQETRVNMETISQSSSADRSIEMPLMEEKRCFCTIL